MVGGRWLGALLATGIWSPTVHDGPRDVPWTAHARTDGALESPDLKDPFPKSAPFSVARRTALAPDPLLRDPAFHRPREAPTRAGPDDPELRRPPTAALTSPPLPDPDLRDPLTTSARRPLRDPLTRSAHRPLRDPEFQGLTRSTSLRDPDLRDPELRGPGAKSHRGARTSGRDAELPDPFAGPAFVSSSADLPHPFMIPAIPVQRPRALRQGTTRSTGRRATATHR